MSKTFRFDNVDKVQKQLRAMPDKALLALRGALLQEGEIIMTKSKRVTPVAPDGGTLRNSGFVDKPKVKGDIVTVELGFGGAAKAYATAVHETPSKHDPPSWVGKKVKFNVGGPKFLQNPTEEAEKGFGKRIGRTMEQRLRKGL